MPFEITPAHAAIFDAVKAGDRNLIISAVAGAGKTSTILEALELIPSDRQVVFLAFNKSIAEELALRVPGHVAAKTLNGLGFAALMGFFRSKGLSSPKLDRHKTRTLCEHFMTDEELELYGTAVGKLVGLAKGQGLIPHGDDCRHGAPFEGLLEDNLDNWMWMIDRWDVDLPEEDFKRRDPVAVSIDFARKVLDAGLRTSKVVDFDDQLYMTLAYNANLRRFDWVFIDEAQDINPVQRELVARARRRGGRVVAVGDPCQAIYGFRGADSESMKAIQERFDCLELPLHVSYRCPRAVVAEAQKVVSHIQSHERAPEGVFLGERKSHRDTDFQPGDMVVCRKNAPLLKVCYSNIRRGISSFVLGRDIGAGLIALVKKLKADSVEDLAKKLELWEDKEIARIEAADSKGADEKVDSIQDRAECLRVFLEMADTVEVIIDRIDSMFGDKGEKRGQTMLCTVHKSKGLEADRVFLLDRDSMPSKWATQPWQLEQERNLIYVAVTRAKRELVYITSAAAPTACPPPGGPLPRRAQPPHERAGAGSPSFPGEPRAPEEHEHRRLRSHPRRGDQRRHRWRAPPRPWRLRSFERALQQRRHRPMGEGAG